MENNYKFTSGISFRLIATIILVIMLVEIFIYLPSIANFRQSWLKDRLAVGTVAIRVIDIVPNIRDLPQDFTDRLLDSTKAIALVYKTKGQSQLIKHSKIAMPDSAVTADLRQKGLFYWIGGALDSLFFGSDRTLRIVGDITKNEDIIIEILYAEKPLRDAMLIYSRNILILSLIIISLTAAVIYLFINRALIRPIKGIIDNLQSFRKAPENATLILNPSDKKDEIGIVERELSKLEGDLFVQLGKRRHLAELGLAVAKINHDLRNMLTSVQLLSDQIANLDDPEAQRLAPKLIHSLDKAINFAQSVLEHGRQNSNPPKPVGVDLQALVFEAAIDAKIRSHPNIKFNNNVPSSITLNLDPDQIARVMINLFNNSREALESAGTRTKKPSINVDFADRKDEGLAIIISDNGPGLPLKAKQNLFIAFESSTKSGGTGLGLTISREIVEAHGGTLNYIDSNKGAIFEICLPNSTFLG